jgi:hypothetical protein
MSLNLSNQALLTALKAWHLPEPLTMQLLPGGMIGEVWRVEAGDQCFVAKYACTTQQAFEGGLYAAEMVEQHGITSGVPLRKNRERFPSWSKVRVGKASLSPC